VVLVEPVHRVQQLEQDRVRGLEVAVHRDEIDVLEDDHRRLQRRREVDRDADRAQRLPGEQHDRASGHRAREVHRGERLPGPGRPVEQQAAAQVPAARPQPLRMVGDPERLPLDPLEHAGGQDDPLTRDRRERPNRERRPLVLVEVARAQFEHAPAVDVALAHEPPQLGEHALRPLARGRHHLEPEVLAHPVVLGLEHRDERSVVVAHEPEPRLHARDALAASQRHRHVLQRSGLEVRGPRRIARQLRKAGPVPLHDRQPHDLYVAALGPRVDRDLEVRPVPLRKRARDDR
jgi:hypothetical protein